MDYKTDSEKRYLNAMSVLKELRDANKMFSK